mgnify:CR=1 FL=1
MFNHEIRPTRDEIYGNNHVQAQIVHDAEILNIARSAGPLGIRMLSDVNIRNFTKKIRFFQISPHDHRVEARSKICQRIFQKL